MLKRITCLIFINIFMLTPVHSTKDFLDMPRESTFHQKKKIQGINNIYLGVASILIGYASIFDQQHRTSFKDDLGNHHSISSLDKVYSMIHFLMGTGLILKGIKDLI